MPNVPNSADRSAASRSMPPIAERVRQRLVVAGQAFDRRFGASRPRKKRTKDALLLAPLDSTAGNPAVAREQTCLRMVFRELGDAHRRYRVRTGIPGTPALRAAAHAFKQEPSVVSLIPVAAYLDELGILAW